MLTLFYSDLSAITRLENINIMHPKPKNTG